MQPVRRADAENQGSLISRNVTENKENFPACVYIKANERVYSSGTDASSAAPAGLSDGAQCGFMAPHPSLQWDACIQTRTVTCTLMMLR